ncbi:hypothetical protein BH23THE1_BH23THE1_30300 [soil metagenome]
MSTDFKVTGINDLETPKRFGTDNLNKINRLLIGKNLNVTMLYPIVKSMGKWIYPDSFE